MWMICEWRRRKSKKSAYGSSSGGRVVCVVHVLEMVRHVQLILFGGFVCTYHDSIAQRARLRVDTSCSITTNAMTKTDHITKSKFCWLSSHAAVSMSYAPCSRCPSTIWSKQTIA